MKRISLAIVAATTELSVAPTAHAQYWLADRQLTSGRGIRVGNFELHPGVGAEFGFDSNTFNASPNLPTDPALRLRVSGNLALSTLSTDRARTDGPTTPQGVAFRANVSVAYHHFFAIQPTMGMREVGAASNVGVNAGLNVTVNTSRSWSFTFSDDFARAVQGTTELNFGQLFVFNRIQNTAVLGFGITPGGGTFEFRANYTNRLFLFTEAGFEGYNNMGNDIGMSMKWRFLPKTSLAWTGSIAPTFYFNPSTINTGLFSGFPANARLGLTGLLTERISFQVFGGFGGTYFSLGDNIKTFVGNAEVRYVTGPTMFFRAGFYRDIGSSFIGNYIVRNNIFLGVTHNFGGRFQLSGEVAGGPALFGYGSDQTGARTNLLTGPAVSATDGRVTGVRLLAQLFGEYRFNDIVGLNATLVFTGNFIDAQLNAIPATRQGLNYVKFEGFLGLRVNW
jgi:hypothetical protein